MEKLQPIYSHDATINNQLAYNNMVTLSLQCCRVPSFGYIQTLLLKAMYVCTYLANVDLIVLTLTAKVLENNFIYLCQNFHDSFFTSLVNFLKTITNRFLLLQEHICRTDSAKSKTTIIYLQVIEHNKGPFTRPYEDVITFSLFQ